MDDIIKNMVVDTFEDTDSAKKLHKAIDTLNTSVEMALTVSDKIEKGDLDSVKNGTMAVFALANKCASGKQPRDFTNEDWAQIGQFVYDNAISITPEEYSRKIFMTYADYIEISAKAFDESRGDIVKKIADELREKADYFNRGELNEVAYIEESLWLSLEGVSKLLSYSLSTKVAAVAGDEYGKLVEAANVFGLEYGRLKLYMKEQAQLDWILENQQELDEQMAMKLDAYTAEMEAYAKEFREIVDDAFNPDVKNKLRASGRLAEMVGVDDCELLKSVDEVDDFFM